jgi:hypothetical protein
MSLVELLIVLFIFVLVLKLLGAI